MRVKNRRGLSKCLTYKVLKMATVGMTMIVMRQCQIDEIDDGRYQELGMTIGMTMTIIRPCQRRSTGLQGICHSCLSSFLLRATSIMKRFPDATASPSLTSVKDAIDKIGIFGEFSHKGGGGCPCRKNY